MEFRVRFRIWAPEVTTAGLRRNLDLHITPEFRLGNDDSSSPTGSMAALAVRPVVI